MNQFNKQTAGGASAAHFGPTVISIHINEYENRSISRLWENDLNPIVWIIKVLMHRRI